MHYRLLFLCFAATLFALGAATQNVQNSEPELHVSLGPIRNGFIPGPMINGRPVYLFDVALLSEENRTMYAHGKVLLQLGDTKKIETGSLSKGRLRAAIALGKSGEARYTIEYAKTGQPTLKTSAVVELTNLERR